MTQPDASLTYTSAEERAHRLTHVLGVENLLWSTDYPHHGCDWPETRKTVDEMFRGVPDDERRKMTADNAVKLYGLS